MYRFRSFAGLLFAVALVGCGASDPQPFSPDTTAAADIFAKLPPAYMQAYQAKKKPPTLDDLKPFLKRHGATIASLVSPRDNKSIVLVPFVPDKKLAPGEQSILAYEAEGVNGERMLVDSRGMIRLEKAEDFARIKFAGGHQPK
jgi:hypothetical protein